MSLAGQISNTVATLASTREARHGALGRIRKDTARHLSDAQAARRRMASEQQHRLGEALRTIKLGTAILLGEADERIDRYRKERVQQAARLNRALAEGFTSLRGNSRKWLGTQSALRSTEAAKSLRQRQQDRKDLGTTVQELTSENLAFLAALTKDRLHAASLWHGRATSVAKTHASAPVAKAEPAKAEPATPEPVKAAVVEEPVKPAPAPAEAAPAEPVKVEATKVETARPEPAKPEALKADVPDSAASKPATSTGDNKPAGSKPAGDKATSGKSA
uniref:Gas vesicle protein C n=1 Tax=Ancylobacter aquaticus TaxID=100 RepID=Q9RH30_ANCAQ|nr:gas vesicle protein C [Ancylobacter aquaticus]